MRYALEPELVATWTDRRDCRYFKESFGVGQGRLVSRYPKRWKKLVWNASVGAGEFERKRLEVLLDHLSEQMLRRKNHNWDSDSGGWIENAEQEHQRCPFHRNFARTNPKNQPQVLTESDLDLGEPTLWAVRDMLVVVRKAKEMADAVTLYSEVVPRQSLSILTFARRPRDIDVHSRRFWSEWFAIGQAGYQSALRSIRQLRMTMEKKSGIEKCAKVSFTDLFPIGYE